MIQNEEVKLGFNAQNIPSLWLIKIIILFLLLLLVYSNSLLNKFILDDAILISDAHNYLTHNLKFIPKVFANPLFREGNFYRPLSQIFLILEYPFFKSNPLGYHFVNILIHFVNCLLLFKIINFLFNDYGVSLLSSLLFAVHPIHNTIINPNTACDNLMVNMCMLVSLMSFIRFSLINRYKFYYLSIGFFIIALLFHERAILLPFYLICLIFFYPQRGSFKKYIYLVLPFIICSFVYLLFRLFFFSLRGAFFNEFTKSLTILNYIFGFSHLILIYLSSIIIPKDIVIIWGISPQKELLSAGLIAFLLISLVLIYISIRFWKKDIKSFCILWFLIGALPTALMMSSRYHAGLILQPHWLYLSSMGVFLFISVFLFRLKKYINFTIWVCVIIFILLFYCMQTRRYNYLWREPQLYYEYWLNRYPNNIARFNLANIYLENGKYSEAELLYKEVLSHGFLRKGGNFLFSSIETSMVYNNIGTIYYNQNKLMEAKEMFSQAIKLNCSNSKAYFNRASVFLKNNQIDKALLDCEKSVEADPYNLDAHYNLAIIYARLDNKDKALEEYSKAVALDKNCFN